MLPEQLSVLPSPAPAASRETKSAERDSDPAKFSEAVERPQNEPAANQNDPTADNPVPIKTDSIPQLAENSLADTPPAEAPPKPVLKTKVTAESTIPLTVSTNTPVTSAQKPVTPVTVPVAAISDAKAQVQAPTTTLAGAIQTKAADANASPLNTTAEAILADQPTPPTAKPSAENVTVAPKATTETTLPIRRPGPTAASPIAPGQISTTIQATAEAPTTTPTKDPRPSLDQTTPLLNAKPLIKTGPGEITAQIKLTPATPLAEPSALLVSEGRPVIADTIAVAAARGTTATPVLVRPEAFQQVADVIRVQTGDQRMVVRLDPPELGRVGIDLSFDNHRLVSATLSAESGDTANLLRRHLDSLQRELSAAGFEGVNIDFAESSDDPRFDDKSFADEQHLLAFKGQAEYSISPSQYQNIVTAERIDARF